MTLALHHLRVADGPLEEPSCRRHIPSRGDEHVDDLPELDDGGVDLSRV